MKTATGAGWLTGWFLERLLLLQVLWLSGPGHQQNQTSDTQTMVLHSYSVAGRALTMLVPKLYW